MRAWIHILTMLLLMSTTIWGQQQVQIFTEDFESSGFDFVLNDTIGPSTNTGANKWIVNNAYNGAPLYPNTISQDSTTIGTITNAPNSNYLHIHDSVAAVGGGPANCNFDEDAASDRFAYTTVSYCTRGLTDVKLVFFYTAVGDTVNTTNPTAYGEVYYSADGGPWTLAKNVKYTNQRRWRYEQISNPGFNNVSNLRVGFRWFNDGTTANTATSFGVDDIQMVGTYDPNSAPVNISVLDVSPDSLCPSDVFSVLISISDTLCDGQYGLTLSRPGGQFNFGTTFLGFVTLASGTNFINVTGAQLPSGAQPSGCYRIRIDRISPPPTITGTVSACFPILNCLNSITTLEPIVATDPDTLCALSAIDVPFYSTGPFNPGNQYIAELSDSNGDFTNAQRIGANPDANTYDPASGSMPGNVSGLVPSTPAGCNYFIRVRATNGATIGTTYGPFCIKQCDMRTNNSLDVSLCITQTVGADTTITVDINYWNFLASYFDGNEFALQLLDRMTLGIVNTGALAALLDTSDATLTLSVPGRDSLVNLGIGPGSYYARIVADSSSVDTDENGTIIRLTIGAPDDTPPDIIILDSIVCNTDIVNLAVDPYKMESQYEWSTSGGSRDTIMAPNYFIIFNQQGNYIVQVREINYGCAGGFSEQELLNVIASPFGDIAGPTPVCEGDTVTYDVPFIPTTFYEWTATYGSIVDTSNSQIVAVFDSVGTVTLSNSAVNRCGSNTTNYPVVVNDSYGLDVLDDQEVCAGESFELKVLAEERTEEVLTRVTNNMSGFEGVMFDVVANADLTLTGMQGNFYNFPGNFSYQVYFAFESHVGIEQDSTQWSLIGNGTLNGTSAGALEPLNFLSGLPMTTGDTLGFYVVLTGDSGVLYTPGSQVGGTAATDGVLDIKEGQAVFYKFGQPVGPATWSGAIRYRTSQGLEYLWSTGQVTETIGLNLSASDTIFVQAIDSTGCEVWGSARVTVNPVPIAEASDSADICLGDQVSLTATYTGEFVWRPSIGIDSVDPDQIIYPEEDITYVLTSTDPSTGCTATDTVSFTVSLDIAGEDTMIFCGTDPVLLELESQQTGRFQWSTGDSTASLTVDQPGVYSVTYFPANDVCASQFVFEVIDYECDQILDIPDAFSPNNDGLNDHFTVFGDNIIQYEILIYNRWGELVYASTDAGELNDLNRGWDGTHKGKLQNIGTFVYQIRATDIFGLTMETQGNLTLVR